MGSVPGLGSKTGFAYRTKVNISSSKANFANINQQVGNSSGKVYSHCASIFFPHGKPVCKAMDRVILGQNLEEGLYLHADITYYVCKWNLLPGFDRIFTQVKKGSYCVSLRLSV